MADKPKGAIRIDLPRKLEQALKQAAAAETPPVSMGGYVNAVVAARLKVDGYLGSTEGSEAGHG